jgi:hypothetical protein
VDPRAGLNDLEKRKFLTLPGLELRHLIHPAHSQSLYRLRYPGSHRTYYLIYLFNDVVSNRFFIGPIYEIIVDNE